MDRAALWPQVIFDEIGVEDPDSWYKALAAAKSTVPTRLPKPGVALLWQASGSSGTVFRGFDPFGHGSAEPSLPLAQVLDAVAASDPHPGRDADFAAALPVTAGER